MALWTRGLSADGVTVHGEPVFLPWHRYFVQVYEDALHECGYTGAAMYWDWVADSGAPSQAAVWDPVLGFGGNGSATSENGEGKWRVVDGPFRNLRPTYWNVVDTPDPHYLSRDFPAAIPQAVPPLQEMIGWQYNQAVMDQITPLPDYLEFRKQLESRPHGVVHSAIGSRFGDMGPNTSPNGTSSVPFFLFFPAPSTNMPMITNADNLTM
jgi:tyrosinase